MVFAKLVKTTLFVGDESAPAADAVIDDVVELAFTGVLTLSTEALRLTDDITLDCLFGVLVPVVVVFALMLVELLMLLLLLMSLPENVAKEIGKGEGDACADVDVELNAA